MFFCDYLLQKASILNAFWLKKRCHNQTLFKTSLKDDA